MYWKKELLKRWLDSVKNDERFGTWCRECRMRLGSRRYLVPHYRLHHRNVLELPCPYITCQETYLTAEEMQSHYARCHSNRKRKGNAVKAKK